MSNENVNTSISEKIYAFLLLAVPLVLILLISRYNFLFFHSLAEIFSIVIAGNIFIIAWNSRRYFNEGYLLLVGSGFIFIGIIDMLTCCHTGAWVCFRETMPTLRHSSG